MMEWRVRLKGKPSAREPRWRGGSGRAKRKETDVDGDEASACQCELGRKAEPQAEEESRADGLEFEAMLALQTSSACADDGLRNDAIEVYRAMRRAKLSAERKR